MAVDGDPEQRYPGITLRRAVDIALRTVHIAAAGILLGGHWFGMDRPTLVVPLWVTVATGAGLIVTEVCHSRHWPHQVRGLLVMLKLAALCLVLLWWRARVWVLLVVLVVGMVGSHMPRRYRHYSLIRRRPID